MAELVQQLQQQLAERDRQIAELVETVRLLTEENQQLRQRVAELEDALGKRKEQNNSKPPSFSGDYSLGTQQKENVKRKKKSPGRTPNDDKLDQVQRTENVYPDAVEPEDCVFCRERFVWRIEHGRAVYVRYRLFRQLKTPNVGRLHDVLPRGEYGVEIAIILAYLAYGLNLSIDQARELMRFFTHLELSRSQADSLLGQLGRIWETELETLSELLALATVVYIDETGWKVSSQNCYAWVFTSLMHTVLLYGRGRDQSVLEEILPPDLFEGIGVSDDYAVYRNQFPKGQKCWAHLLRKAIKLMLAHPGNPRYREFFQELLALFREGRQIQQDGRYKQSGRERRKGLLEEQFQELAWKYRVDEAGRQVPGGGELAGLLNEMIRCLAEDELFTFVVYVEVDPTNNRAEQTFRDTAQARSTCRTSKTESGAKRRSVIRSVLVSLRQNLESFTLENIVSEVVSWYEQGKSLFERQLEELRAAQPPPAELAIE